MGRARKKRGLKKWSFQREGGPVTLPPAPWDYGATGPANRVGLEMEDAVDTTGDGTTPNPNRVTRVRRIDLLETWHRRFRSGAREYDAGPLSPHITTRQYNAAVALRDAYEATLRAPGWPDNDRVQSSPKPDHAVTIQIDRMSRYHAVARHVATEDWPILRRCVIDGQSPGGTGWVYYQAMQHLREALDRLATGMGA